MRISNKHYLLLSSCILFTASCATSAQKNNHTIINNELLLSHRNINESIDKKRTPLLFSEENIADNCKTYFEMIANHQIEESVNNQIVKSEYLICDAIKILSKSSDSEAVDSETLNLGKELLTKLDLRTFNSSLFRQTNDNSYTLKSLFAEQTSSQNSIALAETEDWFFCSRSCCNRKSK